MLTTTAHRVPVRYIRLMASVVQGFGVDAQTFLQAAGIDSARFADRGATLSASELDSLILAAEKLTGRQDLGFELGRQIKINSHDLLGYGLMSAETVGQLLSMAARHHHLMTETWNFSYRRGPDFVEVITTPVVAMPPESLRFRLEMLTVAQLSQLQQVTGNKTLAYDIYLSMPAPAHLARYLALAPVRFHFRQSGLPGIRAVMPVSMLDIRLPLGNPEVFDQIDEHCSTLASRPGRGVSSWVDYITMVLRDRNGQQVTLDELAKRLNVSARTIDRQLRQNGIGFRQLSDKVRFEIACEALGTRGVKVTNIAQQMGFCDTASFSNAFKRVVGISPSEYALRRNPPASE